MAVGQAVYIGQASCFLSYDTLAAKTGLHRVTVVKAIKELQKAGWISVMRTRGRRSNTYALSLPVPLRFPDEETRQLADIAENKAANWPGSNPDKIEQGGNFATLPAVNIGGQDEAEQLSCCATVGGHFEAANSSVAKLPLSGEEQSPSYATDADRQQLQNAAPTVVKLDYPIIEKKKKTYNPLGADDGNHSALFERLWALWGGGGFEDRAKRRFDKTLMDGVDPAIIIAAAERRRKRLDRFGLREAGMLYLWLRRGDWQREPDVPKQVFVEQGTKAGRAWERNWLETKCVRPPWQSVREQGFKRGWYFPSEFPPEDTVL